MDMLVFSPGLSLTHTPCVHSVLQVCVVVIAQRDSDNPTLVLAHSATALVCAICIGVVLTAQLVWLVIHSDITLANKILGFQIYLRGSRPNKGVRLAANPTPVI
jgi:hypothetical protein